MSQTLYRHWAGEELLYVGISNNPFRRIKEHSRDSRWWDRIDRITLEHFTSRSAAEKAERGAIDAEAPRYNKLMNEAWLSDEAHQFREAQRVADELFPRVQGEPDPLVRSTRARNARKAAIAN